MKPILFNTDMVKAILRQRKTVTRRMVRFPLGLTGSHQVGVSGNSNNPLGIMWAGGIKRPTYQPGDILYVRETFFQYCGEYIYRASTAQPELFAGQWNPSIHMPKEAARIFLMVKDVFAQKIQDITDEQAKAEGCKDRDDFSRVWNKCYAKPQPVKKGGVIVRYESYPWEDIRETRTYRGLPWVVIGNPWVWVVEFEQISREEALECE